MGLRASPPPIPPFLVPYACADAGADAGTDADADASTDGEDLDGTASAPACVVGIPRGDLGVPRGDWDSLCVPCPSYAAFRIPGGCIIQSCTVVTTDSGAWMVECFAGYPSCGRRPHGFRAKRPS